MRRTSLGTVLVVALVVLAGCSGAPGSPSMSDGSTDGPAGTAGVGSSAADAGTISFYVSDRPNAIDDFEHLNVTITKVGLHRTGDAGNETATPNATETGTANETESATGEPEGGATETEEGDEESEQAEEAEDDEEEQAEDAEDDEGERAEDAEDDEGEDAEWVEYEVNETVDLTRLVGDNATKLGVLEAPSGTYDKVFVYVSEIDATLENGESVNVKLPSEKLQINKQFEVGSGSNVSFVFDIAVHKAGKSGKYILRPVVSQSGTGVPIDDVDEDDEREEDQDERDEDEREENDENADDEEGEETEARDGDEETEDGPPEIDAEFQGKVAPGKQATVKATGPEGPLAGATVEVNGEVVGTTDERGTLTFQVAADAEKLEVTVTKGDAEAELETEFDDRGNGQLLAAQVV